MAEKQKKLWSSILVECETRGFSSWMKRDRPDTSWSMRHQEISNHNPEMLVEWITPLKTFSLIVSAHPYCARKFTRQKMIACENSRPSSLPATRASRATRAGSEEGRLFSQAKKMTSLMLLPWQQFCHWCCLDNFSLKSEIPSFCLNQEPSTPHWWELQKHGNYVCSK